MQDFLKSKTLSKHRRENFTEMDRIQKVFYVWEVEDMVWFIFLLTKKPKMGRNLEKHV